jgi:formate hydrogenlyase subunit 3/multisubunit Na+/H+ antiporter MnhD subunit
MNKAKGVSSEKKSPLVSVSSSSAEQHRSLDPSWRILVPLLILTALIIVLGFWPSPVYAALTQAVSLY